MKNLKVSLKLILGFSIAILLTIIVGTAGMYGMYSMEAAASDMYAKQATPLGYLLTATDYFQRLRVQVRNAIIYSGDANQLKTVEADMKDRMSKFEAAMQQYNPSIATDAGQKLFDSVSNSYYNSFKPGILAVLEGAKLGQSQDELLAGMAATTLDANQIAIDLSALGAARLDVMRTADEANSRLGGFLFVVIIVVIVSATVISLLLSLYISNIISAPLKVLTDYMKLAGELGDITISKEEQEAMEKYGHNKDEIGQCINYTNRFIRHITTISDELQVVASGDLRVDVHLLSERDGMGQALKTMIDNLNSMFGEINKATSEVSSGSKQIADGSQILAQGSTEQAAAIEQLSSSVSEIAQKTRDNAEIASKATNLANTIKSNAEKGSSQMDHMMQAVKEINQASQGINKVIRVIDDIAFQTNILALNAAVEAARAGQHGKGFAVVAEEVRNLAAKSAAAAKDTGGLIANSIEKAELGARIADETAASLVEIVSGINESSLLVEDIAKLSNEQSVGISQINKGIDQVASVIQQNSATAEESSAASQEMSGQANMLEDLICRFKLKQDRGAQRNLTSAKPARKQLTMPERESVAPAADTGGFGKY